MSSFNYRPSVSNIAARVKNAKRNGIVTRRFNRYFDFIAFVRAVRDTVLGINNLLFTAVYAEFGSSDIA